MSFLYPLKCLSLRKSPNKSKTYFIHVKEVGVNPQLTNKICSFRFQNFICIFEHGFLDFWRKTNAQRSIWKFLMDEICFLNESTHPPPFTQLVSPSFRRLHFKENLCSISQRTNCWLGDFLNGVTSGSTSQKTTLQGMRIGSACKGHSIWERSLD